ncbi:ACT domain-containing protein [Bacillus fonticola]|uniref:ACT domain-containing protein n=1 Tax=Bacillus fonticola TaxID=2728853 RepID=UPI00147318AB|nr:ACT domain-containing protein [Bacillus fonticola]
MKQKGAIPFVLVREDILPDGMKKVLQAKSLLERGKVSSVQEAVDTVDMSRSAFYKYRHAVLPFRQMMKAHYVTLFFQLEDERGSLSKLLDTVAHAGGNVMTIHQTLPLSGRANVTLSLETTMMSSSLEELLAALERYPFVEQVDVVGSGV